MPSVIATFYRSACGVKQFGGHGVARWRGEHGVGDRLGVLPPGDEAPGVEQAVEGAVALHVGVDVHPTPAVDGLQADEAGLLRPVLALVPQLAGLGPLVGVQRVAVGQVVPVGVEVHEGLPPRLHLFSGGGRDGAMHDGGDVSLERFRPRESLGPAGLVAPEQLSHRLIVEAGGGELVPEGLVGPEGGLGAVVARRGDVEQVPAGGGDLGQLPAGDGLHGAAEGHVLPAPADEALIEPADGIPGLAGDDHRGRAGVEAVGCLSPEVVPVPPEAGEHLVGGGAVEQDTAVVGEGHPVGGNGEVHGCPHGVGIEQHVGVDDDGHVPVARLRRGLVDRVGAAERTLGSFALVDLPVGEVVEPPRSAEGPQAVTVGVAPAAGDEDHDVHRVLLAFTLWRVDLR